jgi:hypothetical protein
MTNAATLRETAARTREHAREYDAWTARPLLEKARALEWEAALLERAGRERRQPPTAQRDRLLGAPRAVFGRAAPRHPSA